MNQIESLLSFIRFRACGAFVHLTDKGVSNARMRAGMLALVLSVATLIVGILTLVGVWYTRQQVKLVVKDDREKKLWAAKHAEARRLVLLTYRFVQISNSSELVYEKVFPDPALRESIETYLVEMLPMPRLAYPRMLPRALDPDYLLLPTVQDVIRQTIDAVEKFKREHPQSSEKISF